MRVPEPKSNALSAAAAADDFSGSPGFEKKTIIPEFLTTAAFRVIIGHVKSRGFFRKEKA